MKPITLQHLRQTACAKRKENSFLWEAEKKKRKPRKPTKEVRWVENELRTWCEKKGLELIPEFRFNPLRKYRFDWYIKELNLGIEYMGLQSQKSGHTTLTGYTKDTDKLNLAIADGYKVHYFTVLNYKEVITTLENNLK